MITVKIFYGECALNKKFPINKLQVRCVFVDLFCSDTLGSGFARPVMIVDLKHVLDTMM